MLFILPWLDTSKVKSLRFRPVARGFFIIFVVMCLILGWCGAETPDNKVPYIGMGIMDFTWLSRIGTIYYFAYFLVIMPVLGMVEKPKDIPESITKSVLGNTSTSKVAGG